MRMDRDRFERLVAEALEGLPDVFQQKLDDVIRVSGGLTIAQESTTRLPSGLSLLLHGPSLRRSKTEQLAVSGPDSSAR